MINLHLKGDQKLPDLTFINQNAPLFYHFKMMAKLYHGHMRKALGEIDIDRYYIVLSVICSGTDLTQQCLSKRLRIDKASMVRIIDYLNKHGYVVRQVNPLDRRQHIIRPTKKAQELSPKLLNSFDSTNNQCLHGFSETEKTAFYAMIQRMIKNLSSENK